MADWYEELFDDRYLVFFEDLLRLGAPAEEIEFIDRALALDSGARILDLGCGFGRHALPLAERGYRVTGLDLSERMLEVAGQVGERLGVQATWLRRDMRQLHGLGPFEACVCLYTAFGYFSEEENEQLLRDIYGLLTPDGRLLLDVNNPISLVYRLPEERWGEVPRGVRRESHRYEPMTGRLVTERTFYARDGSRVSLPTSQVRLYAPHELRQLLQAAGFEVEQVHGGLRGQPLVWNRSVMQSWVARRA